MILQNIRQLHSRQRTGRTINLDKRLIGRREDGHVLEIIHCGDEVGFCEGAGEGCEGGVDGRHGWGHGDREDRVDAIVIPPCQIPM